MSVHAVDTRVLHGAGYPVQVVGTRICAVGVGTHRDIQGVHKVSLQFKKIIKK